MTEATTPSVVVTVQTHRRWVWTLVAMLLVACAAGGLTVMTQRKVAQAAIQKAEKQEAVVQAAVAQGKVADSETSRLRQKGEEQEKLVQADQRTIATLKAQVAKLKRSSTTPPTPIEEAQDEVIAAQDTRAAHQDAAVADYKQALEAKTAACDSYKVGLDAEQQRSAALALALKVMPKARPWSAVVFAGTDQQGARMPGIGIGRSWGIVRVEAITFGKKANAIGVGISW